MSTRQKMLLGIASVAMLVGAGCTSLDVGQPADVVAEREDILLVREDVRKLSGRIDQLRGETDQLWDQVKQVKAEQKRLADLSGQQMGQDLMRLDKKIADLDALRQKDRREVIEQLTAAIHQAVKVSQASARGASAHVSEYGVEHTVASGETLSAIASAYGVSMQTIIKANKLRNPDNLKVGQKIFIPE